MIIKKKDNTNHHHHYHMKSSFPKGVRSILVSSEKNDAFLLSILIRKVAGWYNSVP